MTPPSAPLAIPRVHASAGADKILEAVRNHGGVIIKQFLTQEQVAELDQDIVNGIKSVRAGSTFDTDAHKDFHGRQTKRLTNLATLSPLFREQILDKDLIYDTLDRVFEIDNKSCWMLSAQAIEIGPGNKPQPLHRDLGQYSVFNSLGPKGPEAIVNFLIATTRFTDENGGTRVIPGSHLWEDFNVKAKQEDTIPADMEPGDCLFISGKTVHGGGANNTTNELRRAVAFSFGSGYLTPEEAYPFQVSKSVAKTMSKRAQKSIGFRSQYPRLAGGLWMHDFGELADYLGMDEKNENA
ncbi:hypothetical protein M409DRAFT_70308 [Zasmidium cellare ATCC 36951]|uniref:Fe2OG dioxygenase domain-containing protein n=1 Tax=Zasmidium cellare ATCC 36951 TaxID=1080233 RepID=A0A6A6C2Y7_ZASCE|nr:uncharacterized protein M409DRAFT_70308 [Zasmidium cellare ATCC 36951]KAF2160550.1 hypothetical protein M409DRAFT_70308 [Zasmidium cellare ATCC 36951]